jgi:hypothetical protein
MLYFQHDESDFVGLAVRISKMPIVYVIATPNFEYIKIGRTKSLKQRMNNIQSGCPFNLSFYNGIRTTRDSEVESVMHKLIAHVRVRGEWFRPTRIELDLISDFCTETNKHIREVYDAAHA